MIEKLPDLNPTDHDVEYYAQELHNLTNIKLASCMRIVCELDDVAVSRALLELVKAGVTSKQAMQVYLAMGEVEMLRP